MQHLERKKKSRYICLQVRHFLGLIVSLLLSFLLVQSIFLCSDLQFSVLYGRWSVSIFLCLFIVVSSVQIPLVSTWYPVFFQIQHLWLNFSKTAQSGLISQIQHFWLISGTAPLAYIRMNKFLKYSIFGLISQTFFKYNLFGLCTQMQHLWLPNFLQNEQNNHTIQICLTVKLLTSRRFFIVSYALIFRILLLFLSLFLLDIV